MKIYFVDASPKHLYQVIEKLGVENVLQSYNDLKAKPRLPKAEQPKSKMRRRTKAGPRPRAASA